MDNRYIIIGRSTCPFCIKAIEYCIAKNVKHDFLDYQHHPEILKEYKEFHNHSTVPIILANNLETGHTEKVGGYSELLEYL